MKARMDDRNFVKIGYVVPLLLVQNGMAETLNVCCIR